MMRLTRRYRFSASHRLHSPALTESENRELYGKCNNPHGHGHDYLLEVTVSGTADPRSGRLANVACLDQLVREEVLEVFDHRNLNTEVPEFEQAPPTTENLLRAIDRRLGRQWSTVFPGGSPALERIRLGETKRNIFESIRKT